jgi:hypothetical protein
MHFTKPDGKEYTDGGVAVANVWARDTVAFGNGAQMNGANGDGWLRLSNTGKTKHGMIAQNLTATDTIASGTVTANTLTSKNITVGNLTSSSGVAVTNGNPGPMIEKKYSGLGDRYGLGQWPSGTSRVYAASSFPAASVNLSFAKPDGSFNDVLTANNDGAVIASGIKFSKAWSGSPDKAKDKSEISNDVAGFKKLMIVGNKAAGAERRVGVWDRLDVHGTMGVDGSVDAKGVLDVHGNMDAKANLNVGNNTTLKGNLDVSGNTNLQGRVFFKNGGFSDSPNAANGSDPYYLEKVVAGANASHLRLTINDADESFQIWGDSCRSEGGCAGMGSRQHAFRADGGASHKGSVVAGGTENRTTSETWNFNHGMHARNPDGRWTHFAWKDGVNHIRGDTIQDGALTVNGSGVMTQGLNVKGEVRMDANANYVGRHIDATTGWGNGNAKSLFMGWQGQKVVLGNNANGGHDIAATAPVNSIVATNPVVMTQGLNVKGEVRMDANMNVNGKLCIDDTCITKQQLVTIMQKAGV